MNHESKSLLASLEAYTATSVTSLCTRPAFGGHFVLQFIMRMLIVFIICTLCICLHSRYSVLNLLNLRSKSRSMVTIFCRFNSFRSILVASTVMFPTRVRAQLLRLQGVALVGDVVEEVEEGEEEVQC